MSQRIDTPEEIIKLIELEIKSLKDELSQYPELEDVIDLSGIERELKEEFLTQAVRGGYPLRVPRSILKDHRNILRGAFEALEDFRFISETSPQEELEQRKRDFLKFKNYYFKWSKNLIAELNKAKMLNKWSWLDVKPIAQCLADLKITGKNKNEALSITTESELEELLNLTSRYQ